MMSGELPIPEEFLNREMHQPVSVYVAGSCKNNGQPGARAGIGIYWGPNDPKNVSERFTGKQTNNSASIHAAVDAIHKAKQEGIVSIKVHTRCELVTKGMKEWLDTWKMKGWKNSKKIPVENRDDFEELESVIENLDVDWIHVGINEDNREMDAAYTLASDGANITLPHEL